MVVCCRLCILKIIEKYRDQTFSALSCWFLLFVFSFGLKNILSHSTMSVGRLLNSRGPVYELRHRQYLLRQQFIIERCWLMCHIDKRVLMPIAIAIIPGRWNHVFVLVPLMCCDCAPLSQMQWWVASHGINNHSLHAYINKSRIWSYEHSRCFYGRYGVLAIGLQLASQFTTSFRDKAGKHAFRELAFFIYKMTPHCISQVDDDE